MPVIQVTPDRFKTEEERLLASIKGGALSENKHIRRPVRGTVMKEDSFATLRVVAGSGKTVPLIDAGSRRKGSDNQPFEIEGKRATDIYSNFFIQQVQEERAEKQQILETFGEPFIFFFGERARIISFSGILLNTFDFNWEAEWWYNYEKYIRGTRCVENDARIFLSYDETLVTGYILAAAATKNSQEPRHLNFQFQVFVTGQSNFSRIGNPNALPGIVPDADETGKLQLLSRTETLTARDLDPFRPTRIDTSTIISSLTKVSGNVVKDISLADGLAANVSKVSQTFNSLKNQAETAIKRLSDLANGTIIRVPVGFAGALEFEDNVDAATLREVTGAGVIKYSTFDQNLDEYVGSSDHYGSSVRDNGAVRVTTDQEPLVRDQKMVATATAIWAKAGFVVPGVDNSALSSLLVKAGFGLAAIGANAAWRSSLPKPSNTLASVSPIRTPKGPGLVEE